MPASILLLLFVSLTILSITTAYQSKYRTYDSLELSNINATIKRIEIFNTIEQ
ncbi:hypothetical protein PGC35_11690 [Psychrobacillus sp. PGGUH221]|uniref:hypothetical protein n=1 Tax=Psychrobacillus sp. PGGUH221 TaxID=3020058 RepID=UPI0035C753DC